MTRSRNVLVPAACFPCKPATFGIGVYMTSETKAESNRRNALKSTGPKTPDGLLNSSMNALKHGRRSKRVALLRDEGYSFENRKAKWLANADPPDDMSEFLV